jgi:hypothetical protein
MGVSSRAGNTYLSGAPEITSSFYGGSCFSVFCFLCSALCCISFWSISLQLLSIFIHVIYSLWLPPGFDIQPVITSRLWYTACDYLQALIYSLWLPPGFDIQLVITSRLWYTACDYLQALIYSLWLPPGFDIQLVITSRLWYIYSLSLPPGFDIQLVITSRLSVYCSYIDHKRLFDNWRDNNDNRWSISRRPMIG